MLQSKRQSALPNKSHFPPSPNMQQNKKITAIIHQTTHLVPRKHSFQHTALNSALNHSFALAILWIWKKYFNLKSKFNYIKKDKRSICSDHSSIYFLASRVHPACRANCNAFMIPGVSFENRAILLQQHPSKYLSVVYREHASKATASLPNNASLTAGIA